ncbi:MAG: TonB-dependent receptor [Cryomorphaceae bacterium]|nr:MAG: TonB-dependent receptor [Cryomorphaceae bacterium]
MLKSFRQIFGVFCLFFGLLCSAESIQAQKITISGSVSDQITGDPLIGATVRIKGTTTGAIVDIDGKFAITTEESLPIVLEVSFVGYVTREFTVNSFDEKLRFKLSTDDILMKEVEIVGERIDERQKQAALTVETMDIIAIKETPSGNFYEGLGNLKGVDLTSPSLAFKIINTRGFNSTSPVRSLQLIDGVDNQSPGLNFSLGNFLGASDLDVMRVDLIAGASSAFYGPGAFNGVVSMTTKNPFVFQGLTAEMKVGERNLYQFAMRWADVIKNSAGEDKFAYKLNVLYMQAQDWEATNAAPVDGSPVGADNPGGYDAVNRYGDEDLAGGNNFSQTLGQRFNSPGLGIFYRTGYWESDLMDYSTDNLKTNMGLYYKVTPKTELSYNFNFSNGSTVYQGDNRYRLQDVLFFQNRIEIRQEDKFFIRAYATHEDAGNTYDAVATAFILQNEAKSNTAWNTNYSQYWNQIIRPQIINSSEYQNLLSSNPAPSIGDFIAGIGTEYDDFAQAQAAFSAANLAWRQEFVPEVESWLQSNPELLQQWHDETRKNADTQASGNQSARLEPGTPEFQERFDDITSRTFTEGGSRFFDRSALYHIHGEYKWEPKMWDVNWGTVIAGANGRLYTPNTRGTIFSDTLQYTREVIDGEVVKTDSSYRRITNAEYGIYVGYEKKFMEDQLKLNLSGRMDHNENFDPVFSPAASLVYTPNINHNFRFSFSSAVRNPTLADQYLFYDVGRAILLGNLDGYENLVTLESFGEYINTPSLVEGLGKLEYFDVNPVKPEQVRTLELGYRTTLWDRLYMDLGYYHSWYTDFIGFILGVDLEVNPLSGAPTNVQAYRISTNSQDMVTTQGFTGGLNYYFKNYTLNFNYSFNRLDMRDSEDPIIPAFNTPEHKFNLGISGRDVKMFGLQNWGFSANYKWIEGFLFEGSPQFTGMIDSYDLFDAAISLRIPKWKSTFKLGGSNLFGIRPLFDGRGDAFNRMVRNDVLQVYGGPFVGRLVYFSVLFEFDKK